MNTRRWLTNCGTLVLLSLSMFLFACESDLDKANAAAQAKQYEEAVKLYQKVLKTEKKNAKALRGLAKIHCSPATYKGLLCLDVAKRLLAVKAGDAEAQDWLKRSLFSNAFDNTTSGRLSKAEEQLKQYLKLAPKDGKAYFVSAMVKNRLGSKPFDEGELRVAIKRYEAAIKNSSPKDTIVMSKKGKPTPIHWESYNNIADLYYAFIKNAHDKFKGKKGAKFEPKKADFDAALAAYTKLESLNKHQADKKKHFYPAFQIAMMHINYKGDSDGALEKLIEADKKYPNNKSILRRIVVLYTKKKDAVKGRGRRARRQKKKIQKQIDEYAKKFKAAK